MKILKKMMPFLGILLAGTVLSTCGSLPKVIKEPVLSLHSAELTNIDFTGIDLLCKVAVQNPNRIEVPFPKIDWDLFIAEGEFIKGSIQSGDPIKANKSVIVDVSVHVDYLNLYQTIVAMKEASKSGSDEMDYKVALAATFDLPILGQTTIPFEIDGKMPILRMLKFSEPSIAIDTIDFTGVTLLCSINVENPNKFAIPLPKMDYSYSVNKNAFLSSTMTDSGPLPAKETKKIEIKIPIKYAALYAAIASLAALGEADGDLAVTSKSEVPAFAEEEPESLAGTNKLPLLKAPSISFNTIALKSTPQELATGLLNKNAVVKYDVSFTIENKNVFALNLNALTCNLTVNGNSWGNAAAPKTVIGPGKTVTIPLSSSFNATTALQDAVNLASKKGSFTYACTGNATLAGDLPGLKAINIPLNLGGKL
ncbi:MAG: LEA type 2 family protein [Spirochaetaceae bacterium]|nr:LEA type 2 family protein [Spirochaetaceae bacterium]